jgi:hypothetical protein
VVLTRTLHEPSNGVASAVEAKARGKAANAAARVIARMEGLIMGPRFGRVADGTESTAPTCEGEYQNSRRGQSCLFGEYLGEVSEVVSECFDCARRQIGAVPRRQTQRHPGPSGRTVSIIDATAGGPPGAASPQQAMPTADPCAVAGDHCGVRELGSE